MTFGSFIGFFVGMLPAAGATPAALMAYGLAKIMSKNTRSFGKGNIEGVAAPETANNAASTGSLLPMLTLGIPGSPTTALLLGGMVMWGLVPGPMLFIEQPDFVWGLISSLYTANFAAVLVNLALIPVFVWALRMPFTVLCALVLVLCIVGGFAPSQKMHDVWLIVGFRRRRLSAAQGRLSDGPAGSGAGAGSADGKQLPPDADRRTRQCHGLYRTAAVGTFIAISVALLHAAAC